MGMGSMVDPLPSSPKCDKGSWDEDEVWVIGLLYFGKELAPDGLSHRGEIVSAKSPKTIDSVRVEYWINADQCHLLHFRLRDEESVKRIAMMKGERGNQSSVIKRNAQQFNGVIGKLSWDQGFERFAQCKFANADLDGDFPHACHTQVAIVIQIFNRGARELAQA